MKKKIALLLSFVLAFALALGVFAGCSKNKGEEVTVYISKTELSVEVQKTGKLTATASDGSDIVWSSSDETVATVSSNGTVTGVKAGSATVTATVKDGTAKADCAVTVTPAVTFTFTQDGTAATTLSVDRNTAESIQVGATASDGSSITSWEIADTSIATVDNTGKVTIIKDGTTTLTVRTTTGNGTITLTVTDSSTGDKYQITNKETVGKWYYYAIAEDEVMNNGRQLSIDQAEFREGKATVALSGEWNWNSSDVPADFFIALKDPSVAEGQWYKLTMTINSSIETSVTVNDTRVDLVKGDNSVTVYYEQWDKASAIILFANKDAGTQPNDIKLVVSDLNWAPHTPEDLTAPAFTLTGNTVKVTDDNANHVKQYTLGLFKEGETKPSFQQPLRGTEGTLDTSAFESNGTYIVRIMAVAKLGFNDSGWSTGNDIKHTVNNADISYTVAGTGNGPGTGAAISTGKWSYLVITQEGASCKSVKYANGTLTFDGVNGWSADCVQLARHYSQFEAGTELKVTMTLQSTLGGDIMVCGEKVTLVANVAKQVTVNVTQSGEPTVLIILDTLSPNHANPGGWFGKLKDDASMPVGDVVFTVSNMSVVEA